jgi:hypothetical protein
MRVMERAAGALFPTGDDIVVLWQHGTLPVLAPFLQDGPAGPCLLPEQTPAQLRAGVWHRSVSYAGRRQTLPVLPSAAARRPPAAGLMMAAA